MSRAPCSSVTPLRWNCSLTELNRVKSGRTGLLRSNDPVNFNAGALQWQLLFPGDNLHELNAAGRDARQKQLGRRDCFTGTAVLGGPVYHEMVVTGAA